jgi:hypothetical protein
MNNLTFAVSKTARAACLCLCAAFVSAHLFADNAAPDARKIIEAVDAQQSAASSISMKATFQVFDKDGHSAKKDFAYRHIGSSGDSRTLAIFTAPPEIRGVALLSVQQRGAAERQYVYTPATDRVRSVVTQERSARFIGTDFSFEDIGEHSPGDFTYQLLGSAETIDGHKVYKLTATPLDSSRSQYKYIYYWVAQDVPVILYAEFYDAQGKLVRVLHATDLKRENGIWGARHTEMRTVPDGTRTVLTIDEVKFNVKLDEKLFSPEGLSAASASAAK